MSKDFTECASIVRKQTLGISANFTAADPEKDESLLKVYDESFSRFSAVIINEQKKAATSNIDLHSFADIKDRTAFASNKELELSLKPALGNQVGEASLEPLSPAFSVKLSSPKLKGMTAADVFLQANETNKFMELLSGHIKFLKDNEAKYPKNKEQLVAISEANKMYKSGTLKSEYEKISSSNSDTTAGSFPIYCPGYRPLTRKRYPVGNDTSKNAYANYCFVYDISVTWNFGDKYPVVVKIENYYAPYEQKENGLLNVFAGKKVLDETHVDNTMRLSAAEWKDIVRQMQTAMDIFEYKYGPGMIDRVIKQSIDARKNADVKKVG